MSLWSRALEGASAPTVNDAVMGAPPNEDDALNDADAVCMGGADEFSAFDELPAPRG